MKQHKTGGNTVKPTYPIFIPDYPKHTNISPSLYKYRIELYDKDNDKYQPICYHDDLAVVTQIAMSIETLIKHDMLVSDTGEPFDTVIVYDNLHDNIIIQY